MEREKSYLFIYPEYDIEDYIMCRITEQDDEHNIIELLSIILPYFRVRYNSVEDDNIILEKRIFRNDNDEIIGVHYFATIKGIYERNLRLYVDHRYRHIRSISEDISRRYYRNHMEIYKWIFVRYRN